MIHDGAAISEKLIKQIYASVLDVSFAHTGGIIAVVPNFSNLTTTTAQEPTLNKCDDLLDPQDPVLIAKRMQIDASQKIPDSEIKKRMLKRKALLSLVAGREFSRIDRKLRAELISMDGACILSPDGCVCSAGAIIRNDSGSSGGGRSAAAKKLSSNGGMAVKVSTDGYIELFIDYTPIYAIK